MEVVASKLWQVNECIPVEKCFAKCVKIRNLLCRARLDIIFSRKTCLSHKQRTASLYIAPWQNLGKVSQILLFLLFFLKTRAILHCQKVFSLAQCPLDIIHISNWFNIQTLTHVDTTCTQVVLSVLSCGFTVFRSISLNFHLTLSIMFYMVAHALNPVTCPWLNRIFQKHHQSWSHHEMEIPTTVGNVPV